MPKCPARVAILHREHLQSEPLLHSLHQNGLVVQPFESATEFLAVAVTQPFDCLLLDSQVPEVSRLYIKAGLQSKGLHLPVIAISGQEGAGPETSRALGAVLYLAKPLNENTLLAAIAIATESRA